MILAIRLPLDLSKIFRCGRSSNVLSLIVSYFEELNGSYGCLLKGPCFHPSIPVLRFMKTMSHFISMCVASKRFLLDPLGKGQDPSQGANLKLKQKTFGSCTVHASGTISSTYGKVHELYLKLLPHCLNIYIKTHTLFSYP